MARRVYVAEGFVNDCDKLIQRCSQFASLNYEKFCGVWKDMDFVNIFHGRASGAELAELSEEVLHIAKHYMVREPDNFEESVAGLFLTYALLNLQPYAKFAALRLVPGDVEAVHRLADTARRHRRCDVLYILGSVLVRGPCHFHAAQRERGMEVPIRKYLEGDEELEKMGSLQRGVFFRQDEELGILKELHSLSKSYSQAKVDLCGSKDVDRSLKYVKEDLATDLDSSLRRLLCGIFDERPDCIDPKIEEEICAQTIKERAMKNIVNPMKHLTGLQERKTREVVVSVEKSPIKKTDIKSRPGKVKRGSPMKALATSSPRKRKAPHRKPRKIKKKNTIQHQTDSEPERNGTNEGNADLNVEEFLNNSIYINGKINSLPVVVNTETDGKQYEIEIIDQTMTNGGSDDRNDATENDPNVHAGGEPSNLEDKEVDKVESDSAVFKVPKVAQMTKREQKKSALKSKFKRMGILPIANFNETQ